ncbi:MAG: polyprenol monophosphomannose synthase [Flavobacteriales bacterium Tduv]
MADKIIIIPTYNEKENIEAIIRAIFYENKEFDILIVDDNSSDGTINIVEKLQKEFEGRLHLQVRKEKNGLGQAYIHGFIWVLEKEYAYIFEMDADFSHNPADLIRLYEACQTNDVAIGSRYSNGVNVVNWPIYRVLLSYFASKYVGWITGLPIHDTTAGFICYKRNVLESIPLKKINCSGYLFQIKMKYIAWKKGFKIKEIPIIFTDRVAGSSKMSSKIITEALWGVLCIKIQSLFKKTKIR